MTRSLTLGSLLLHLLLIVATGCDSKTRSKISNPLNQGEQSADASTGAAESPTCDGLIAELKADESRLATEVIAGFPQLSKTCNHDRPIIPYGDEGVPSIEELVAAIVAIAPDSSPGNNDSQSSLEGSGLIDTEIACQERTAQDPTGCAAIHAAYLGLEGQINARLNATPFFAPRNERRSLMVGALGGASRIIADITVPHCNRELGVCRIRAQARGVSSRGWATGACYQTIAQKAADSNWAVFTCADGLRCDGYVAPSGILGFLQRPTYGTCRIVDQQRYDSYFRFNAQKEPPRCHSEQVDLPNGVTASVEQFLCLNLLPNITLH